MNTEPVGKQFKTMALVTLSDGSRWVISTLSNRQELANQPPTVAGASVIIAWQDNGDQDNTPVMVDLRPRKDLTMTIESSLD
jgi:hypothetical protein